jgi:hypothetical protein
MTAVFAATSVGLLRANPTGEAWTRVPAMQLDQPRYLAAHGSVLLAADFKHLSLSEDNALKWKPLKLPDDLSRIGAIAVDNLNNLWVGAPREPISLRTTATPGSRFQIFPSRRWTASTSMTPISVF